MSGTIRIGIDVGGTFTHAVAIDNRTLEVVRTACFPTTHKAAEGVALGVWRCLEKLVEGGDFKVDDVIFVAHSTTQATNALLEGDVAKVGLLGVAGGVAGMKARKELAFTEVKITDASVAPVTTAFFNEDDFRSELPAAAERMARDGAGAFVVAQPFAVDDPAIEQEALALVVEKGYPATATHQISGLYGLRARTRTSIVNASILPKMLEVSKNTRSAVDRLGIRVPLMIMRSDGGVMDAAAMGEKPILTILSGPAAGVSAAILYEKISNGLFVEVGGTSTDISLIRNGQPQRKNAVVGGHALYLKTLDVRTLGVAGGSMMRVRRGAVYDVGPRSAHIAGLPYACFVDPGKLAGGRMVLMAPRPADPADYAVIEMSDGTRAAVTTTCAANRLGELPDGDYASGDRESATAAFEILAKTLGGDSDAIAAKMLDIAVDRLETLCAELIKEYACGDAALTVVGGGGGASVVAPPLARRMKRPYRGARNAPVISAIGVGMAMMKETIEKSAVNPTEDDIRLIRSEVIRALSAMGCDPAMAEVQIEVDSKRNILRATGVGASALVTQQSAEAIGREDAEKVALENMNGITGAAELAFEDESTYVFTAVSRKKGFLGLTTKESQAVAVVDGRGIARLTLKNARLRIAGRDEASTAAAEAVEKATTFGDGGPIVKPMFLVYGGRVIELAKAGSPERVLRFIDLEISEHSAFERFCFVYEPA